MLAHIDEFGGLAHASYGGLEDGLGFADERHDRAVGGLARVNVKQTHLPALLYLGGDGVDHRAVAALAEIRHAFYDLFHFCVLILR